MPHGHRAGTSCCRRTTVRHLNSLARTRAVLAVRRAIVCWATAALASCSARSIERALMRNADATSELVQPGSPLRHHLRPCSATLRRDCRSGAAGARDREPADARRRATSPVRLHTVGRHAQRIDADLRLERQIKTRWRSTARVRRRHEAPCLPAQYTAGTAVPRTRHQSGAATAPHLPRTSLSAATERMTLRTTDLRRGRGLPSCALFPFQTVLRADGLGSPVGGQRPVQLRRCSTSPRAGVACALTDARARLTVRRSTPCRVYTYLGRQRRHQQSAAVDGAPRALPRAPFAESARLPRDQVTAAGGARRHTRLSTGEGGDQC